MFIYGGYIYVEAVGDGIDINGSWLLPTEHSLSRNQIANDNGAIDYDGSFKISGWIHRSCW
ncbi:MAG: hypothetical protein U5K79_22040 [Cyclobacteriaceae bacterium]|nr:hypothetical protein [Cyclobacteriaceae bacterium]